jgi:hypothetical protein
MGYDVSGLPAYVEQHKFDLIAASTAGNKTAGLAVIQTGIKGSATINIINSPVTFQSDDCSFSASGTTTLTQRTITVGAVKINETLCEKDLVGKYAQTMLAAGANAEGESPVFEAEYFAEKTANIAYELEKADWQGDTASGTNNLSYYDGFLKLIDAASPVNGNTSATTSITGITAANVISLMWDMYQVTPEAILDKDDLVLFVGMDTFRLYEQAIYDGNLFHYQGENDNKSLPLVGSSSVRVEGVQGLTATNRMILGRASNFYIGVDLEGDEEQFDMWYSQDDRIMKFAVAFKRGTQVAFPAEVVEFTLV